MSNNSFFLITSVVLAIGLVVLPAARRAELLARLGRGTTVRTVVPVNR